MPNDHAQLVSDMERDYPSYGNWEFSYEHPGFFGYYLKGTRLSVMFTPDHDKQNEISIQVDNDGRDIDSGEVPFTQRTAENLFNAVKPWLDKHGAGRAVKGRSRGKWIIEWTSIDPSNESTRSYDSREDALEVAANWARQMAKQELDDFEWDEDDDAPTDLKAIILAAESADHLDAVQKWLDYQGDHDPDEKISIGPSGAVSDSSSDLK